MGRKSSFELLLIIFKMCFVLATARWLFILSLVDIGCVRKYVGAFFEDYNTLIPRSALRGATPSEVYLGSWLPA
jgi:hypothetical protein